MRAAGLVVASVGAIVLAIAAAAAPALAADGWRAAFLVLGAPPIGAVALLLIARVTGADWDAALLPIMPVVPWLVLPAIPMVIWQAVFHWPAGHLHLWLSPFAFAIRSILALTFWGWTARSLAAGRDISAGPLLLAHGLVVSVMGYDWLLGAAPGQPNSAAPMMLAVMQIGGAAAFACAAGLGRTEQRRDLAYLIVASALGLAYLFYIDFAIVWFGNLPEHVGWYVARQTFPAAILPGVALLIGLMLPILARRYRAERSRAATGGHLGAVRARTVDLLVRGRAGRLAWPACRGKRGRGGRRRGAGGRGMSQEYEGWDVDARPLVRGMALFLGLLLTLVIGTGLLYHHVYAPQTRPDPEPFPAPELETTDSAPTDRRSVPAPTPPAAIDRAMAATAARGDALWND